jgi:glycosyltransferase involved in cell wall biosynthesis
VWGEEAYAARLRPLIAKFQASGSWEFLGVLPLQEMAAFFPNLDLLVVPSLNSTETFGFVQVEAMMSGTPCIASDLPGVRQPVTMTGMGKIIPVGDVQALANAILEILDQPDKFKGNPDRVVQMFHPDTNAAAFEALFSKLLETMA